MGIQTVDMRRVVFGVLLLVCPVFAADAPPPGRRLGLARPITAASGREVYGRVPTIATPTPLADILRDPARFADRPVRVDGTVSGVCQRKGCWMTLRDGSNEVRVRFRDYGFFVPLDASGRTAAVEGVAKVEVTSEALRRHLAEDAGRPPEEVAKITGDASAVQIVADAVELCGAGGCGAETTR
jgi:hypothetical protein